LVSDRGRKGRKQQKKKRGRVGKQETTAKTKLKNQEQPTRKKKEKLKKKWLGREGQDTGLPFGGEGGSRGYIWYGKNAKKQT